MSLKNADKELLEFLSKNRFYNIENNPTEFLKFSNKMKKYLEEDLKRVVIEDKEIKEQMLSLLNRYSREILRNCNKAIVRNLMEERKSYIENIDKEIKKAQNQLHLLKIFR